jgi:uncharacterized repeat protein (TIGR03843 family)
VPEDERTQAADHLTVLARGEVEVLGRLPWSSNQTFLVRCCRDGAELVAVYKPGRGERRLWDFPSSIYRREVAAYKLSETLGWGLVPETVERDDAPFGPGSLQRFVDADFSEHHFTLVEDEANHASLMAVCAFDVVANNADRKSGHCLVDEEGRIWAIDNGLCFHPQPKLRTVIWEFAGEEVPAHLREDLDRLLRRDELEALRRWLSSAELEALRKRARTLVKARRFPVPDPDGYHYPWPLV